jgi:hypothetical protein
LSIGANIGDLGRWNREFDGFLPSMKSNSKADGNQITFVAVDFQPHPPTLAPVFTNLDQEMDLMIGSFNFRVG